jgi:hypothetical protein
MRFIILLSIASACFGQGQQNVVQTGIVDARGANWLPPSSTFTNPPSSPATGSVYIFTDAGAVGTCSGGGSALATCRWSGSAWAAVGGGGTSSSADTSIFSGGFQVLRSVQCASGTTSYTALTAAAPNQEITIQTGMSGNVRWDQVTLSETTQFAGTAGLTVSMGRPGSSNYEMTGTLVPLMVSSGDANFWTARPIPPQLSGTYSIVLNFAVTSGYVNAATAGVLTWEVCGYAAH